MWRLCPRVAVKSALVKGSARIEVLGLFREPECVMVRVHREGKKPELFQILPGRDDPKVSWFRDAVPWHNWLGSKDQPPSIANGDTPTRYEIEREFALRPVVGAPVDGVPASLF